MRRRTSLAAVAALLLGLVAGCAGKAKPDSAVPVAATTTPAREELTPQVADKAFRAYITNDDVARASGDERLGLTWTADGQSALIAAEFRKAAFTGDPVARYDYGTPALYVPKLTTDPQWFVAVVDRTPKGADAKEKRTAIMAFIRRGPGLPWTLSLTTVLQPKAKVPKIAVGADGYATALATTDGTPLMPPRTVPGIHAVIAQEGPESVNAKLIKAGPATTGLYEEWRRAKKTAGTDGLAYDTVFVATSYPIYALRTADGGALVLYTLGRDSVTFVKDEKKGRLTIPRDAAHLLDSMILGDELDVTRTLVFGAYDPPKPKGHKATPKADVIAMDGAVTRATSPEDDGTGGP